MREERAGKNGSCESPKILDILILWPHWRSDG